MMDQILMMVGAVTLLLICIGALLVMSGVVTVKIDGERIGKGKK